MQKLRVRAGSFERVQDSVLVKKWALSCNLLIVDRLVAVAHRCTARQISSPNLVRQLITFDTKHDEDASDIYDGD